ncbi:hypothetical protein CDD83_9033 [Cordyceps sp. RAO-2017]|nr:hypothetical protein CDD83_9033 [Cordyceps sp. RAO-2017]
MLEPGSMLHIGTFAPWERRARIGGPGEPLQMLQEAEDGIVFLNEGTRTFTLGNGARFKVYASPYTPTPTACGEGAWAFQYRDSHRVEIDTDTDVVVTHRPPARHHGHGGGQETHRLPGPPRRRGPITA